MAGRTLVWLGFFAALLAGAVLVSAGGVALLAGIAILGALALATAALTLYAYLRNRRSTRP